MAMPTPQAAAASWASNLANSTNKIKAGVSAVQTSPTAKAAAAVDRQVQGVMRAAQSGKTARALNNVSLSDWQNAMTQKGIPRIAAGATQAQPKMQAFLSEFLPYVQNAQNQLASTPRGDLEQNIARSAAMQRSLANFKYSKNTG